MTPCMTPCMTRPWMTPGRQRPPDRPTGRPRRASRSSTTTVTCRGWPSGPRSRRPRRRSTPSPSGRCSRPTRPTGARSAGPAHRPATRAVPTPERVRAATGPGTPAPAPARPVIMSGSGIIEPVEEDDEVDDQPGRSWLWLAALVAALALVLLAVVVAFNVGRGRTPLGAEPEPEGSRTPSATRSQTADAGLTAYDGVTATDFDPQGEDLRGVPRAGAAGGRRRPRDVLADADLPAAARARRAQDGRGTRARPRRVRRGRRGGADPGRRSPPAVSVYVTETAPRGVRGLTPAASATADGTDLEIALDEPATGRFVTVWLTSLPAGRGRLPRCGGRGRGAGDTRDVSDTPHAERPDAELLQAHANGDP